MAQSSSNLSIVRVGSSSDSLAEQLTNAVIGYMNQANQSEPEQQPDMPVLKISNKYFDAHVALKHLSISSGENTSEGQEDGIFLLFEDNSKQSFNVMAELHAKAEANNQNGDLLRLCVGAFGPNSDPSSIMTAKEREEEYARRVLWCLDHGYEYVEKVDLSPDGIEQGHDDREKEGFARIIEAIQGTVWSSAKMHPKKKQNLQESYQKTQLELQENDNDAGASAYEPPPTTLPMPTLSDQEEKEREENAKQALLKQDGVEETCSDLYLDGKAPSEEERIREQRADKIMSDMEGALKEANRIRDMSRAGELSDDDRKKRAGDAANLILNLMNQMGGLESDSENENEIDHDSE